MSERKQWMRDCAEDIYDFVDPIYEHEIVCWNIAGIIDRHFGMMKAKEVKQ